MEFRAQKSKKTRRGISGTAVVLVLFVLMFAALFYVAYQESVAPKASISISSNSSCSTIGFKVTNNDNRILHGWSVNLQVSPSDQHITVSPSSDNVIALAPKGTYSGSFGVSFSSAPPGNYQIKASLVNGTQSISTSNSITCSVS